MVNVSRPVEPSEIRGTRRTCSGRPLVVPNCIFWIDGCFSRGVYYVSINIDDANGRAVGHLRQ